MEKKYKQCQSCGMPMKMDKNGGGSEKDGSINKIYCPQLPLISLSNFLKRSSNSPRCDAPATKLIKSSERICLFNNVSGTLPSIMRCANPSTIDVFPTPASPIRRGLFLVLRERICMIRSISEDLATTGSNFPSRASTVKSVANWDTALFSSCFSCSFLPVILLLSLSYVMPTFTKS